MACGTACVKNLLTWIKRSFLERLNYLSLVWKIELFVPYWRVISQGSAWFSDESARGIQVAQRESYAVRWPHNLPSKVKRILFVAVICNLIHEIYVLLPTTEKFEFWMAKKSAPGWRSWPTFACTFAWKSVKVGNQKYDWHFLSMNGYAAWGCHANECKE